MYLEKIDSPSDIKKLKLEQLQPLADEVRAAVLNKISKAGGHSGPNLGVVELTVALHYVFDSPKDKIVYDVSHQSYPHKILTGRKKAFLEEEHFNDVIGYTDPKESEHDFFTIGHTSTSISLALGLAKGRDVNKRNDNIIALIGDGSLSGGEAFEGLNTAGEYNKNLIIIANDNDQSIAENHGGIYKKFRELRETKGKAENNFFKGFGLDYRYLDEGHDIAKLVELLESVKGIDHPVVLHIHTIKEKGLSYAEKNREAWHAGGPFHIEDGSPRFPVEPEKDLLHEELISLLERDDKAVILNAATPMGLGFVGEVRKKYADEGRFVDVGIAEENAMAMASGVAKGGGTAVFGTYATFLQRTYDQLSHDVCLNDNPVTLLVLLPGVYGMNVNTHTALSDIAMFAHIPNLIYLAPTSEREYIDMFRFATSQKKHPVALRVPTKFVKKEEKDTDYSIYNKAEVVKAGKEIAIIGVSNMLGMAIDVANELEKQDKKITVINPRFLSALDEELLESLKSNHRLVITLEDAILDGGYGQMVASFYGLSALKVKNFGFSREFHTNFNPDELLSEHGMSVDKLVEFIKNN